MQISKKIITFFGVMILLVACGSDFCVFGVGECDQELLQTELTLTATASTVGTNGEVTFSTTGGTSPYTYSLITGSCTLDTSTGVLTASTIEGACCVRVTDNDSETDDLCVNVQDS